MAIQLNSFSKNGLINCLRTVAGGPFQSNATLRLYPNTVPFPSSPVNSNGGLPAGHILSYTGLNFANVGNTIVITSGTTTAAATAGGTLGWWGFLTNSTIGNLISDSITLSGGGGIIIVNTLTPTNGQNVTITFNLTMGA